MTAHGFDYRPFQEAAVDFPEIPEADFLTAAQFIDESGHRHSGASAMLRALSQGRGPAWPLQAYQQIPGLRTVLDAIYRLIANHRSTFSMIDRFCWGKEPTPEPPEISHAQWVLGPLTGVSFFVYGATFIPRWEALYGWYYWAILASLIGGPLLAAAYGFKLRNIFRILGRVLIILAAASPMNALATFGFTRLPLKWDQWALLVTPVACLVLFLLAPLAQKIFRKLCK